MGKPGLGPQKTCIFDIIIVEDNTFDIRFENSTIGRDATPDESLELDLFAYVYKFGLQPAVNSAETDGAVKMMFTNLSAFDFLKTTLPYATNKL